MTMDGTSKNTGADYTYSDDELRAIQLQLESLVQVTNDYPVQYSLGTCDFLFESREDIERILESLADNGSAPSGGSATRAC